VASLLRESRVIDDQHRVGAAHQALGRLRGHPLERLGRPRRAIDKVMQLLRIAGRNPRSHRRHALALARAEQTR